MEAARAEVDRLIAQGKLPAPPPSDVQELLNAADLKTVRVTGDRAEFERKVAQGALPRPPISDAGLLASIGIDLEAMAERLNETFGQEAYWQATQRVRNRPTQAALHRAPRDPPLHVCARVLVLAAQEAVPRGQEIGPELGVLTLNRPVLKRRAGGAVLPMARARPAPAEAPHSPAHVDRSAPQRRTPASRSG